MYNLTLEDILKAKEQRKLRQYEMRKKYNLPIISATINMPGSVKDTSDARSLMGYAVDCITKQFSLAAVQIEYLPTGPEAILSVYGQVNEIKKYCIQLEEEMPFGRLLDLDVFSSGGELISRADKGVLRKCFVCGQPAVQCMRERNHTQEELLAGVRKLFYQFRAHLTHNIGLTAAKFGALALEAMLYEAAATPSPGLVDRVNSGAHKDMDFYTFMSSAASLAHTMNRFAQAGLNHSGEMRELFEIIRYIGLEGEKSMFEATKGINTHKGSIFSLGIVTAAIGFVYKEYHSLDKECILNCVAQMTKGIVKNELESAKNRPRELMTAGERLYLEYGVRGIRGEMESGLPSVRDKGLPELEKAMQNQLPLNDALLQTLLVLMTCVEDTTVMNRHNPDMMNIWVKGKIEEVLRLGGMYTLDGREKVKILDDVFIKNNVSPGGAADMLAVTWLLYQVCRSVRK